jgi:hypothetical protein
MKNLLKLMFLFVAMGILVTSCKTASVLKRHYNKGYYVSHSSKKNKVKPITNESSVGAVASESLPQKQTRLNNASAEQELSLPTAADPVKFPTDRPNKKHKQKISSENSEEIVFNEPSTKQFIKNPFKLSKAVASKATGDDALSLIWILIVVLLIIYVVGLLMDGFGLGGLIHILAVIALVLLILWLLKII